MKNSEAIGLLASLVTAGTAVLYSLGWVVLSAYGSQAGISTVTIGTIEMVQLAIPLAGFIGVYGVTLGMNVWDYRRELAAEMSKGETGGRDYLVHMRIIVWLLANYLAILMMGSMFFGFVIQLSKDLSIPTAVLVAVMTHIWYMDAAAKRQNIGTWRRVTYVLITGAAAGWGVLRIAAVDDLFWPTTMMVMILLTVTLLAGDRIQGARDIGRRSVAQLTMLAVLMAGVLGFLYARGPLFDPLGEVPRTGSRCLFLPRSSTLPSELQGAQVLLATGSVLYAAASDGRNYRVPVQNTVYTFEPCDREESQIVGRSSAAKP